MMSESRVDDLVQTYLERLDWALQGAPPHVRDELREDIREHIALARAEAGMESEAHLREILDRLGPPEQIAQEAWPHKPELNARFGAHEILAIILLLIGGVIVPVLGWLVGAVLLWTSRCWNRRAKLIGTLILPGGLLLAAVLFVVPVGSHTSSGSGSRSNATTERAALPRVPDSDEPSSPWVLPFLVLAIAAPIGTTAYLIKQLPSPR